MFLMPLRAVFSMMLFADMPDADADIFAAFADTPLR